MEGREKQSIESCQRVKTFLQVHPAPAPASYGESEQILDEVITKLTDHSSEQVVGTHLSQAEQRKQQSLMKQLRDRHLRPIVAIAKASMSKFAGIDKALRLPSIKVGAVRLLAEADAIKKAAELYQPVFVKNGRPADFLEQLSTAMSAVDASTEQRGTNVGRQVGAKAGIGMELRRGRAAVRVLDSIVRVAFEGNEVVLAEWRVAKRIRALPGGAASTSAVTTAIAPTQPAPAAPPASQQTAA